MDKLYKNNVRLNDIAGVNRLLARVINGVIQGDTTEEEARVIGYLSNILIKGLEKSDLETRLEQLEQLLEERKAS